MLLCSNDSVFPGKEIRPGKKVWCSQQLPLAAGYTIWHFPPFIQQNSCPVHHRPGQSVPAGKKTGQLLPNVIKLRWQTKISISEMVLYSEPIGKSIFIRAAIAQYFEHLTIIHYLESRVSRHPWTFFSDSDRLRTYRDSPKSLWKTLEFWLRIPNGTLIRNHRFQNPYYQENEKTGIEHLHFRRYPSRFS